MAGTGGHYPVPVKERAQSPQHRGMDALVQDTHFDVSGGLIRRVRINRLGLLKFDSVWLEKVDNS